MDSLALFGLNDVFGKIVRTNKAQINQEIYEKKVLIWIANGIWIIQAVKEEFTSEIYILTGLCIFFTLLTLELTIDIRGAWMHFGIF